MSTLPPCVLHEDEHLLVVAKPSGWNTHAPGPFSNEGIYDWLRYREPRWSQLALVHRLDKDTSGVLVMARTPLAGRSLTAQFAARQVRKRYVMLTDRSVPAGGLRVESWLRRAGARYESGLPVTGREQAITVFSRGRGAAVGQYRVVAEPLTGRTHQIRVHAADSGFPVLGDVLYGGSRFGRLCLHAERIEFRHPESGVLTAFEVPADFDADPAQSLRAAFIDPGATSAWRMIHGDADGWPGCRLDRLGEYLLLQSESEPPAQRLRELAAMSARGVYHKRLRRDLRGLDATVASPVLLVGEAARERFAIRENGVHFELGLGEGYSVGLFLDQRDNRRRLLVNHIAPGFSVFPGSPRGAELLNAFAYTCGFSVCAALSGARVTSLDLSRRYLEWGRRNFELNGLDPKAHDFIHGDAFEWLRRLARKGRRFDAVILDPPTFSQSKTGGAFRAERDYPRLVTAALPLLAPGGVMLAATNALRLQPAEFLHSLRGAITAAGRRVAQEHYVPQPPDFPVSRADPAYLKTAWIQIL